MASRFKGLDSVRIFQTVPHGSVVFLPGVAVPATRMGSLDFISLLTRDTRMVIPSPEPSPVVGGHAQWYQTSSSNKDTQGPSDDGVVHPETFEEAVNNVVQLLREEEQLVEPSTIVLGGFGQGASVAFHAAHRFPFELGAVILCDPSTSSFTHPGARFHRRLSPPAVRINVVHHRRDNIKSVVEEMEELVKAHGTDYQVVSEVVDGPLPENRGISTPMLVHLAQLFGNYEVVKYLQKV